MVDLTQSPYFDDFDSSKNYHRVLFKPGRAVQVREMNQLQNILQDQIKRFANHVFENGAMVIPGESNYNLNYEYVTVRDVVYSQISEILETNDVFITGDDSGVVAQVMQYQPSVGDAPITFYLQYLNGSEDGAASRFQTSEKLIMKTAAGTTFAEPVCTGTGQGSVFSINAGIFYINGFFIETDQQSIILSRYSSEPTAIVGFRLNESVVDWTNDSTLLDNANGSTNFNAIGADRLKLTLNLECYEDGANYDAENFIQLASFKAGVLQSIVKTTEYSVLEDTLARRTYDESGDYTVESFGLNVKEHLNTGTNGGLYTAEKGGLESKFVLGVEPGKAYVRGYEISNIATRYLEVDKAREVGSIDNSAITLPLGSYVDVTSPNTTPKIGSNVNFYSGTFSSAGSIPSGTLLGSALLLSVERLDSGSMRLHIGNIRTAADVVDSSFVNPTSSKSVYMAGSPAFTATLATAIKDASNYGLLYELPVSNVKTLSDTSVTVTRQITATTDTNGSVILTAGTNEVFVLPTTTNAFASYDTTVREIASIATLGGSPTGKTLTLAFGTGAASKSVLVTLQVVKQSATYRTKTLTTRQITIAPTDVRNTNRFYLNKADALKINSIVDANGVNVTSKYRLERNAQSEYYGVSYIVPNAGESLPTVNLTVSFDYFQHGTSGDYFSIDSYSVPYDQIPLRADGTRLSDYLDFRYRKADTGSNDFTTAGSGSFEVPTSYSIMSTDVQYYLPRIDKVYLDSKGNFGTVKGVPNINPKEPKTPDNSMLLYRVYIPAYTLDIADITLEFINNRRYTMRDIGKLEDRISNLEYYTTLSLLETETSAMQITDAATGLNRFKNGFVVDPFVDHSVGNWSSADYKCAISSGEGTLRPEFYADQVDMSFKSNGSGAVLTGSLITLPYVETQFLTQSFASNYLNVNPYAVYRWNGELNLSPNSDTWYDTVYTNPQVTYEVYNNGNLTQSWNSWQLNWAGSTTTTNQFTYYLNGQATTVEGLYNGQAHDQVGSLSQTTTTTSVQVVDDRVVSTGVIPYMRSRNVAFSAKGLKPQSKMYAFFDNVDVTAYCKQDGGSTTGNLVTDDKGNISGVFTIPNNNAVRFRTGTKTFTLNDNPTNVKETSLSYGDAEYTANGAILTRTQSIVATQRISNTTVPYDPLAQSFFVEKDGGVFLTSVELFFATKDPSASVTLEIRNMVNGYPGQEVVPYSKVTLAPEKVNVSGTANVATKFTFNSPVYLADGNEYCFVVMSNSNNYNVYIATMGNKMIGSNAYISKQPFVGVLFKSQNNTTWSADQNSDMKFNVNIAKFNTGTTYAANFVNGKVPAIVLGNNPLSSTNASTTIKANVRNHGLFVGSKVSISGVNAGPGIPLSELNKVQVVTAVVDADNFQFQTTTAANATGTFGGAAVTSERNILVNTLYPIFQELLIENTNVDWTVRGVTGKSISGNETPYVLSPTYAMTPNANNAFSAPLMIPSVSEATQNSNDFMVISAQMTSYADNISPVIDINRAGAIGISNRINAPVTLNETSATGGNAIARYMTSVIGLANPATSLKMFLDISKPQGSNVSVFYRTGNSQEEVSGKSWSAMNTIVAATTSDENTFKEAEFGKEAIAAFGFYQFKIVLTSTSSSAIPKCKRMRGIALGT